jgi:D-alanyl-D-alanine carboxypeptidase
VTMPAPSVAAAWWRRAHGAVSLAVVLLVVAALWTPLALAQEVPELQITSTNYIAIDAETGEIYAQRGAHEHRAPASLTKVFTAIESIESLPPDMPVITSESDLVSEFASQVGFAPGEEFTVEELLYGMMLPSGNDAARALARTAGAEEGDTDEEATNRFLARLNQRIQNMGLTDTHLVDPDGWGVPGHYTTPYDLAAFMMYALRYPRFVKAFSTLTYETADGSYEFRNNNRMLRTYDGIVGGKTGYDDDAGWCLINVAQRDAERGAAGAARPAGGPSTRSGPSGAIGRRRGWMDRRARRCRDVDRGAGVRDLAPAVGTAQGRGRHDLPRNESATCGGDQSWPDPGVGGTGQ